MAATNDDILRGIETTNNLLMNFLGTVSGGFNNNGGGFRGYSSYYTIDDYDAVIEEIRHRYELEEKLSGDLERKKKVHYEEEVNRLRELREQDEERLSNLLDRKNELENLASLTDDEQEEYEETLALIEKISRANISRYETELSYTKKIKEASSLKTLASDVEKINQKIIASYKEITKLTEPWAKADHAASQYAKTIGLAKKGMDQLRSSSIDNVVSSKIGAKYNMSTEELLQAQTNYVKGIGRNVRMSDADQENMAAMHAVMGERGNELAVLFENFGVSMSSTAEHAGKMFEDASKAGISFEKYSDNVAKNFKIAQNYTFRNGIKGLESMAKKATAIRLDMQQVAALADKVSTVEGAIDVSAKLQVLGGPFAQMADPLGMLNEGLNDMESLQDRMAKMIGGMGSFDKATGEVKVSAFNKQRIKAAAEAMGVSYDNLMESVNAQAKRGEIDKQISASATASALPEEMKELIRNSGTFKDGKAGVSIRGQFKSLDELSDKDYEALKKETQTESQDIKDIAVDLRSIKDAREGYAKQREAVEAKLFSALGNIEKWLTGLLAGWNIMHFTNAILKGILAAVSIGGNFGSMFNGRSRMGGSGNRIGGRGRFNSMTKALSKRGGFVGKIGKGLRGARVKMLRGTRSLSRLGGTSLNGVGNAITNTMGGAAKGQIVKGGVSRTMKRAAIKTLGKQGAKTAISMGGKLAAGVAKGGPLGIVGAVGDVVTDSLVASGKMKKGGVGHHIGKGLSGAASGAAVGMMLGSVIPGIGTAIGGAIGGIIGGVTGLFKAGKAKQERKLEEKLAGSGIEVKGKYGRSKLKKINKALETGEISERMRRKLEKNGDTALMDKIDETKIKRAEKKKKLLEAEGVLDDKKKKLNIAKNRFGTANFTVGTANFGGRGLSSFNGLFGRKQSVMGSAIHYGKKAAGVIKNAKDKAGVIIKGIRENGISGAWEAIKANKGTLGTDSGKIKENVSPKDFNININGTLKLTGENGQSVDIIGELRKNPQLLRSLADMISKEISYLDKGTNVVQKG